MYLYSVFIILLSCKNIWGRECGQQPSPQRLKGEPVDVARANAPRIVPDRRLIEPLIEEGCVEPVALEAVEVLFGGHSDDADGM